MRDEAPRKWYLVRGEVKTARGLQQVVIASGPLPGPYERIEVTETGDASQGVQDESETSSSTDK